MGLMDLSWLAQPAVKLLEMIQAGCNYALKPNYLKRIERAELEMEKERDEYQMEKRMRDFLLDQMMSGELSPREQRQRRNAARAISLSRAFQSFGHTVVLTLFLPRSMSLTSIFQQFSF